MFEASNIAQLLACLLPDPAALEWIPGTPKFFSEEKIIDVAEVNQRGWLEKSGEWLETLIEPIQKWLVASFTKRNSNLFKRCCFMRPHF